jgi:two-component system, cell cycle sensor histidine kinase and response regulator CckA
MEKHHSCLNSRAIIEYFEEQCPEAVPDLLSGLGPGIAALPDPREFLMEINNWVSSEVIITMFDNARRLTGNENIAFELGFQSAARKKLGYVQRIILFAYKNPRRSLKRVQAINDKFNKNKKIEIVETRRNRAVIRLHWLPHIPGTIDFCRFNQGIYSGIPTVWNLPPAQVVETQCFFKGDDYCEYHLKWEKKSFFRDFLLGLLVPWSLLRSTIEELELDKKLLKHKFNEVHALNLQLREKIDHLLCLQQTSTAAMSLLQLADMVRASLEFLIQFTKLDRVAIYLLDDKELTLFLQEAVGLAPELLDQVRGSGISLFDPDQLIARVALDGNLVIFSEGFPGEPGRRDQLLTALQFPSGLMAPLLVRHKIIGVLLAGVPPKSAITEADKEFVTSFANQLAIALENARLYGQLEKSERQYRGLVENAHEGIWIVGVDGIIKFANRRMEEITGEINLAGKNLTDFWDPENYRIMETILVQNRQGQVVQRELEIMSGGRGPVTVIMSSVPLMENGRFLGTFAMFNDISEKKAMEKQIRQHQKMEAIGNLAGGIAHNFNNLLMNIMGLTGLILAGTDPGHPIQADLKLIEQEVVKGSALTKQLLSLGQGGKFSPQATDLNALLDKAAELFCRTRSGITITRKLGPRLPPVEVDRSQMEQVMLNLFVNGWQAMSRQGEMTLTSREVTLSQAFCEPYERPPGRYVHLSLTDIGKGMDEPTLARIFEPFFTTKAVGQGTGLGLATVYAIIKNHQGIIRVDSQPGRGTTFHIFLPVSAKAVIPEQSGEESLIRGSVTILLVDDEDSVRMVAARMLEQLGYHILAAPNGSQALEIFRREGRRIALVILDMIMPDMGGAETYRQLQKINPEVRVLLSSGYSLDGEAQQVMAAGARGFIQKPYRLTALSRKVAEILSLSN